MMAEHFVRPPEWTWYILFYFFFAGLTGGLYAIGTALRLWGRPQDEPTARAAFLWAFPILVVCPILLTLDLGSPLRFWHMLVATTPGQGGPIFHYWSPMSVGSWALLVYGVFAFVSFLGVLAQPRSVSPAPAGAAVRLFNVVGALLGLFVASYTGVLLSVSNQPLWSDTWTLGGLFLASGLSGAAAFLAEPQARIERDLLIAAATGVDHGWAPARRGRLFRLDRARMDPAALRHALRGGHAVAHAARAMDRAVGHRRDRPHSAAYGVGTPGTFGRGRHGAGRAARARRRLGPAGRDHPERPGLTPRPPA
jgi:hypothetical protein